MADVVSLNGEPVPALAEPIEAVVKCLEEYLALARSGQIQGLQIVAVGHDKHTYANFEGLVTYAMVGRMQAVSAHMCDFLAE